MSLWTRTAERARAADTTHDVRVAADTAYDQGRRDERAARPRHPFGMTALFVLALVGVGLLALAALNGSFAGGGEVADHQIATAAPVVQSAVSTAGQQAQAAGADLAQKSKALVNHPKS